jgi:hypothetical protein
MRELPADAGMLLGIISDTHGLLRPEAVEALQGVDRIIHAGDVCDPAILRELERIAPVAAVRGNMDRGEWALGLPETTVAEVGTHLFYVLHDFSTLDLDPAAVGFRAVIHGHTHLPDIRVHKGVLFLNPGSAGPERTGKPVTVALVEIEGDEVRPRILPLL